VNNRARLDRLERLIGNLPNPNRTVTSAVLLDGEGGVARRVNWPRHSEVDPDRPPQVLAFDPGDDDRHFTSFVDALDRQEK
jgi:hypothetical protein